MEAVGVRLAAGARAYGGRSLLAAPHALAGEVEQELLDVVGWGFLLWLRMRRLRGGFAPDLRRHADGRPVAIDGIQRRIVPRRAHGRRGIVRGRP